MHTHTLKLIMDESYTPSKRALTRQTSEALARQCVRVLLMNALDMSGSHKPRPPLNAELSESIVNARAPDLRLISDATMKLAIDESYARYDLTNDYAVISGLVAIRFFRTNLVIESVRSQSIPSMPKIVQAYLEENDTAGILLLSAVTRFDLFGPRTPNDRVEIFRELIKYAGDAISLNGKASIMQKEAEARIIEIDGSKDLFSMKESQANPLVIRSAFVFRNACPLWNKYDSGRVLGAGVSGLTVRYARTRYDVSDGFPLFFVVKLQKTNPQAAPNSDTSYNELRILLAMNEASSHWSEERKKNLHHHLILYDWIKCEFDMATTIKPILSSVQASKYSKFLNQGRQEYQIMVEEYAPEGDLESVIEKNPMSCERFVTPKAVASLFAQVFGALYPLYRRGFAHLDLKPANLLIERVPLTSNIETLVYDVGTRKIYVPLRDSHFHLFKIGDVGISVLKKPGTIYGKPDKAVAPGLDVETLAVWVAASMCRSFKATWRQKMSNEVAQFLSSLIQPPLPTDVHEDWRIPNDNSGGVRAKAIKLLQTPESYVAKEWATDYNTFLGVYAFIQSTWSRGPHPEHKGMQLVNRVFAHSIMYDYGTEPDDADWSNSLLMNDYKL